jgi:hypothetical protein
MTLDDLIFVPRQERVETLREEIGEEAATFYQDLEGSTWDDLKVWNNYLEPQRYNPLDDVLYQLQSWRNQHHTATLCAMYDTMRTYVDVSIKGQGSSIVKAYLPWNL